MNSVQRAISVYKTNSQFGQEGSHVMYQYAGRNADRKKAQDALSANEMKNSFDKILKEKMKKSS